MTFRDCYTLAWAAVPGLIGCNNLEVCRSRQETLLRADGGPYRCTVPEDCPHSSRTFVCVTDVSSEQECVRCDERNACVRTIPESCP